MTSAFTDASNNLCLHYTYQAATAAEARSVARVCVFWASAAPVMLCYDASRRAFVLLGPQGVGVNSQSAPMPVDYANTIWPATITLSPWQAEVYPLLVCGALYGSC